MYGVKAGEEIFISLPRTGTLVDAERLPLITLREAGAVGGLFGL